ncbi:MAG: HK97 family phage prohead protease [Aestuariivirga sp.]
MQHTLPRVREPMPLTACSGTGVFVGYASLFGKRDSAGDIVMPGAFMQSIKARGATNIRMLFQHDPAEPVGTWLDMFEDTHGLWVQGRLDKNVQRGSELISLLESGGLDGLSIGFKTVNAIREKGGGRKLITIDLWEVSLVTFPMLAGARVNRVTRKMARRAGVRGQLSAPDARCPLPKRAPGRRSLIVNRRKTDHGRDDRT